MSRIHLTVGIICILIIAVVGMATKLVTLGEGIIILLITLVAAPLLFNTLKNTQKHDER